MGFKLNGIPYNKDDMNMAVYRKDLTDGSAAKSNHTGIIIDKDLDPEMEKAAIAHEKVHQYQQRKGDLDYDKENFYWKGKTYPRENLNEHNEDLPWEKEAYAKSNGMLNEKNTDMKKSFKLDGYRGNGASFANLTSKGLMGASQENETTVDPVTGVKTKRRVNRKGQIIEKTKYKNKTTGEKGGSKKIITPGTLTTQNDNTIIGGLNLTVSNSNSITPNPTKTDPVITPPGGKIKTSPSGPPDKKVIPPAPPGKKATDPGEYMKGLSNRFKGTPGMELFDKGYIGKDRVKEYDGLYNPGLWQKKMVPKKAKTIDLSSNLKVIPVSKVSYEDKVEEKSWSKKKKKTKEKFKSSTLTRRQPPVPDGLFSTKSSTDCGKGEGKCSPGGLHTEGMFGSPTGKDRRDINKQMRKVNKSSRKTYRKDIAAQKDFNKGQRKWRRENNETAFDNFFQGVGEKISNIDLSVNKKPRYKKRRVKKQKIKNNWSRT